jgi:hypothetical protein
MKKTRAKARSPRSVTIRTPYRFKSKKLNVKPKPIFFSVSFSLTHTLTHSLFPLFFCFFLFGVSDH